MCGIIRLNNPSTTATNGMTAKGSMSANEEGANATSDWQVKAALEHFNDVHTYDRNLCLVMFSQTTRLTQTEARHFLESCSWDIQEALGKAFETRRKQATQNAGARGGQAKAAYRMGNLRGKLLGPLTLRRPSGGHPCGG
jgi:hypothetical protein